MDVGLSTILLVLVVSTTVVQSQILKGPANALKKVGGSVTLECVTSSKNCDQVEWSKMEGAQSPLTVSRDGIMLHPSLFPRERYSLSSTGGCSLTITLLQISDSGKFSCSQLIGDEQETKGSVLVVIGVRESCSSNVPNNALNQNDSYSFSTAINVPAKSVEPSNVILSFLNKTVGETETTDDSQPQTVKTTLTGIARTANRIITQRVCRASLSLYTATNFDRTAATLDVCSTQQLIVSYPVESVAVSPPTGPYHKGDSVRCVAKGHPYPTFKWTHLKSGNVVDGDSLVIIGDDGDQYTCTATNAVKRRVTSQTMTIEVSSTPQPRGASIGIGVGIGVSMLILGVILFAVLCRRYSWAKRTQTDDESANGEEDESERATVTDEDKFNENESSLTEYESLQQGELSPSDAYESLKPKKSDKNKKF